MFLTNIFDYTIKIFIYILSILHITLIHGLFFVSFLQTNKHTGVLALDQITTVDNIKIDIILRNDFLKRKNMYEKRVDYSIIPTV